MTFIWSGVLWLALAIPALAMLYTWLLRRRKKWVVSWSSIAVLKAASDQHVGWRRHVPPAIFLAAMATLVVAAARPTAVLQLLHHRQTVILVMDVSGSMRAEDVVPNRLAAAQEAAKAFVEGLPAHVRIGVVSYAGTAHVAQAPTRDHEAVLAAIDRFQLQPGTAIGSGLTVALATLFPDAGIQVEPGMASHAQARLRLAHDDESGEDDAVAPGSYRSAVIVLLSDGQNTTGVNPMRAAELAARRGVKVFTVGFGTRNGIILTIGEWRIRVRLDEATLDKIATLTHGAYLHAADGQELQRAYETMSGRFVLEPEVSEITALFALAAALLVMVGGALSWWWYGPVR